MKMKTYLLYTVFIYSFCFDIFIKLICMEPIDIFKRNTNLKNVRPFIFIPTYPFSFIQSLDFNDFPGPYLHQVLLGRLYYRQYIIQKVNFCMILEESSSYCFGYQCPKQLSFLSLYCLFLLIFCKIIG